VAANLPNGLPTVSLEGSRRLFAGDVREPRHKPAFRLRRRWV
jgi:hypothetical protein